MEDAESSSNSKEKPKIVVVSNSNSKPKSLIKLITGTTHVNENSGLVIHPWEIKTKYYSTTVEFYGIDEQFNRTDNFNSSVEALIIHTDCNNPESLTALDKWIPIENDCDLEIKLLIVNYCNENTPVTKLQATEWCLKKGYELIELYPQEKQKENDIIPEKFGADRIVEALQAHVWPNLILNETTQETEQTKSQVVNEVNSDLLNGLVNNEDDDFTDLFSQLHLIKDSMKTIPHSQRKQCAEQVVTAFWKAIGGDPEEIDDL